MTFGEIVREARESVGITQEAVAKALGVHTTYISKVESSRHMPNPGKANRLAHILGIDQEDVRIALTSKFGVRISAGEPEKKTLDRYEARLLSLFRRLNSRTQAKAIRVMRALRD